MPDLTPATLRAWREARRLSRRAAAALLGIPEGTLTSLEYGRSPQSALWGPLARIIDLLPPLEH
jgi:transcriptional regulator with XRE-family HTH domain